MFTQSQIDRQRAFLKLAQSAHREQKRRDGLSYISHPVAVARIIEKRFASRISDDLLHRCICTAFIHDVFEDTPLHADVVFQEISNDYEADGDKAHIAEIQRCIESALIVSNLQKIPYHKFVDTVIDSRDEVAIIVKYCDIMHNASSCCVELEDIDSASEKTAKQLAKYGEVLGKLTKVVKDIV